MAMLQLMIILSFTLLAFEQKTPITGKRAHTSFDYRVRRYIIYFYLRQGFMVTVLWRNWDVENATISGKLEIGLHYLGVLFPDTFCPTLISFFLNEVAYSAI